jgi:D-glycero-D-manno-heptose 1,7-bisphosphate phosphatase
MPTPKRVVFLDRDGTINVDHGYVHKISDWNFTDHAPAALKRLSHAGYSLAVVSNQAGIADGRFSKTDVNTLHDHMAALLKQADVTLESIAYCPHPRNAGCDCRKPESGLAREVESEIGPIDYANSWMIGDKESDIGFGKNISVQTALIRSDYWKPDSLSGQPDLIVDSLYEFAKMMPTNDRSFDRANWHNEKIVSPSEAGRIAGQLRTDGHTLVTTNGSFDLVHAGHLDQLEEARKQGDVLFVGVNADRAVSAAKGPTRPIIPEEARAAMLAALTCVDFVVILPGSYSEEPMLSLLESVKPDIHVNGPDYVDPTTWVEWATMQKYGTQGHTIVKRNSFSTSEIVKKIRAAT